MKLKNWLNPFNNAVFLVLFMGTAYGNPEWSAVDVALSGTSVARLDGLSSAFRAPSVLVFPRRYQVLGSISVLPQVDERAQIGAGDSMSGPVTLGLSYIRDRSKGHGVSDTTGMPGWLPEEAIGNNPTTDTAIGVSVATRPWGDELSLGVTASYHGRVGTYGVPVHNVDLTPSAAVYLWDQAIFVASALNVLPFDYPGQEMKGLLAARWEPSSLFNVELDISSPVADPLADVGASVESLVLGMVPVRAGYSKESGRDYMGVGIGLWDPQIGVDLGVRAPVDSFTRDKAWLAASVWLSM